MLLSKALFSLPRQFPGNPSLCPSEWVWRATTSPFQKYGKIQQLGFHSRLARACRFKQVKPLSEAELYRLLKQTLESAVFLLDWKDG
jgi:hypothetical protein